MKEIIYLKLTLAAFAIFIAYQLARAGRKRLIGFKWSFFFGLLYPIIGVIIVFTSKKQGVPIKPTHILIKILSIALIIIGVFWFMGNISTNSSLNADKTETAQTEFNFLDESSEGLGRLIGGGVLTIFVSSESWDIMDYRAKRNIGNTISFLFISLGIFLLRKKKAVQIESPITSN